MLLFGASCCSCRPYKNDNAYDAHDAHDKIVMVAVVEALILVEVTVTRAVVMVGVIVGNYEKERVPLAFLCYISSIVSFIISPSSSIFEEEGEEEEL